MPMHTWGIDRPAARARGCAERRLCDSKREPLYDIGKVSLNGAQSKERGHQFHA